ncbi:hypothetical protein NQ315_011033 [Exocentrus adspersus]|uniref:Uncharacterized protein n=1 Tax=Exocentrus adspersus TaxID=1586481 RepID=A0AAV8VEH5_9CUCU|nr:hypothetical protein NQ315_011033 [Exocentrus adspersus]
MGVRASLMLDKLNHLQQIYTFPKPICNKNVFFSEDLLDMKNSPSPELQTLKGSSAKERTCTVCDGEDLHSIFVSF